MSIKKLLTAEILGIVLCVSEKITLHVPKNAKIL